MNMPGFTAEAALLSGDERHWGIALSNESNSVPRVVLSSLWDVLIGGAIGLVTGGPLGAIAGGIAGGIVGEIGGDSGGGGGGGIGGFVPCYPFGPCIGNGIRVGNQEMGVMAQMCYPGGLRTTPCWKPFTYPRSSSVREHVVYLGH